VLDNDHPLAMEVGLGIDDQSGSTHHFGHCRHGWGATVSGSGTPGQDQWKPEELDLRRDEVQNAKRSARLQSFLGLCAAAATVIAAIGALYAAKAVNTAAEGIERQANADRLSTAISAIGGEQAAERVAGFGLLRRHVQYRLTTSKKTEDRLDAYDLYTNALDVLENYLRNPADVAAESTAEPTKPTAPSAGLGFGRPNIPYDNKYAARELQNLLKLKPQIQELYNSFEVKPPAAAVDLANVQLAEQSWAGIDFGWLGGHWFPGIDLRGANLTGSIWGASWLVGAHLQCANLEGADLRGANLTGANLSGAYLKGTDFTGANLEGTKLDGATLGKVSKTIGLPESKWPEPGVSRAEDGTGNDGIAACLDYGQYWDKPKPTKDG
jgi:hypothetical protein